MNGRLRLVAASIVASGLAASPPVRAEGLDAERFVPAVGAEGGFVAEHPHVPAHLGWGLGLFFNLADDAVVERSGDTIVRRVVDTAVSADLLASVGLFGRLELGLHLPLHLYYDGDPYPTGGTTLAASAGLGDLRFVPKLAAIRAGGLERHFLLGFALPVTYPTGDAEALRGGGGISVEPRVLVAAHVGRIGFGLDLGYRWRAEHPATLPFADELTITPWLAYAATDALALRVEGFGGKHFSDVEGADFPFEVLGGVEYRAGGAAGALALYGGAGAGLTDGIGDPDFRVVLGVRYRQGVAARQGFGDSDGDGILDNDDACAREAEDTDGFHDEDGCPEADNDGDGIADGDDECPDLSGEPERRGCPRRTFVKIEEGQMIIIGKVQFRSGSADIENNSDPLLDQIAQALDANQQVTKLRIEGHTDDVGDDEMNRALSEQRARAVKAALVKRGVGEGRLETVGVGEARPIAPNTSAGGRQKNRRVEFVIVGGGS